MLMILVAVPGNPLNGGTDARFMAAAMQAPLEVPANGASLTVALATLPLGSKVTITVASPVGPPASLHFAVSKAAVASALLAAFGSKRCPLTPFFSSALRAPFANSSAKPALGVAVSEPPPGGSSADRELAVVACSALAGTGVGVAGVGFGSAACVAGG